MARLTASQYFLFRFRLRPLFTRMSLSSSDVSSNLWQQLREACDQCHHQLTAFMTDNDGVYAAEEILTVAFIKSRLSKNILEKAKLIK